MVCAAALLMSSCAQPAAQIATAPSDVLTADSIDLTPKTSAEAWEMPGIGLIESTSLNERIALINPDIIANQQFVIDVMSPVWTNVDKQILDFGTTRPADKRLYSDQQLLNELALSIAAASLDADFDTSAKMLSIAIDPDSPEFQATLDSFHNLVNGNASRAVFQTTKSFLPLTPGMSFMGTTIGLNEEARVTQSNSISLDGSIDRGHFRLLKISPVAGNQAVTQMGVWYDSDPRVLREIRNANLIPQ